jgi:hypothetical protein
MAPPLKKVDPKLVQDLAALGCKTTEIASVTGVSVDTLDRRFADEMAKGRDNLRVSLRRWQLEAAKKGNVTMLIWLGKQLLGQSDKIEQLTEVAAAPGFKLVVEDYTKAHDSVKSAASTQAKTI